MRYSRAFVVWFWISSAVYVGYGAAWTQGRTEASSPAAGLALTGFVHLQDIGDVPLHDGVWAGTKGQSRRLEGFSVNFAAPVPGLGLTYMCHLQDAGDGPWMPGGVFVAHAASRDAWKVLQYDSVAQTLRSTTSFTRAICRIWVMWVPSRTGIFAEHEGNRAGSKRLSCG